VLTIGIRSFGSIHDLPSPKSTWSGNPTDYSYVQFPVRGVPEIVRFRGIEGKSLSVGSSTRKGFAQKQGIVNGQNGGNRPDSNHWMESWGEVVLPACVDKVRSVNILMTVTEAISDKKRCTSCRAPAFGRSF
jgi:hypothetical protein